jgi:hypothetical protein
MNPCPLSILAVGPLNGRKWVILPPVGRTRGLSEATFKLYRASAMKMSERLASL